MSEECVGGLFIKDWGHFIKDSSQRLAESSCEELQLGMGNSKGEGRRERVGQEEGRERQTESQSTSVNILSAICCAREVWGIHSM